MTESTNVYTAVLDEADSLSVRGGRIMLSESSSPHVTGDLDIAIPSQEVLSALDTRSSPPPRVQITAEVTTGGSTETREFDLTLRERRASHVPGRVTLTLASDEALVLDYAPAAEDRTPLALQSSARAVVQYVIGAAIPGATLAPGVDADLTRYWNVTNLIPNPRAALTYTGWTTGDGASGIDRIPMGSPLPEHGAYAVGWAAAAGNSNIIPGVETRDYAITPGSWYVFTAAVASSITSSARAVIQWWSANGTILSSQSFGDSITTDDTAFRPVTVIAQAPPGASHAVPYVNTTGNPGGNLHYATEAMFYEDTILVPYFDPTITREGYVITWAREPHASTSTRVALDERPPDALIWEAGRPGLEFLMSVLQSVGLRIVCDETRRWTLRDETYTAGGTLAIRHGINLIDATDTISRTDDTWFDAAITRHTWTDANGNQRTASDVYAPTGYSKLRVFEKTTPYPGPGFSEYVVRRAQGRGREVSATIVATWRERVEQGVRIVLDGAPIQLGKTSEVTYDLDRDEVTVNTRTTDTPPGAIDLLPGTIDGLTGTIDEL